MIQFLKGKKTYILGICGILYAIFGFITGNLDSVQALSFVFGCLTAMGLRNGITTEMQNLASLLPDKKLPPSTPSQS